MPDSVNTSTQSFLPQSAPDSSRRIFFGPDGLRAGWALLIFLIIAGALLFGESALARHYLPKRTLANGPLIPPRFAASEGVAFVTVALAAWITARLERRPFREYGLNLKRGVTDLLAGLAWGLTALAVLVGSLYAMHLLAFDGIALHARPALVYAAEWGAGFLLVGCFEEFLTRGFLQYTVARGISGTIRYFKPENRHTHAIGFWTAAFLFSALLFMAGHLNNKGETPFGILSVGAAGLTFAFSLWRTGTLWWAIGLHAAWDWAQSFLYGVADSGTRAEGHFLNSHPVGAAWLSGGSTGPEGSVLAIPTLILICAVIHITLPRRPYQLTPSQKPPSQPM